MKAGIIEIDPFDEANVRPASIDLTLDDFVTTTDGGKVNLADGKVFVLKSGHTISADTKEWIALPQDYIGRACAVTRLAGLGIMTSHGFQIEPGFNGNLRICIFNAGGGDVALRGGMPIISLEIMPLSATPARHDVSKASQK